MIILGLSGGSGSGKTTVAAMFAGLSNAAVFDADKEVHLMYEKDIRVINLVQEYFPDSVCDGRISRESLVSHFLVYDSKWRELQSVIYKKLLHRQKKMVLNCRRVGVRYLILDIPLLMEEGFWRCCDAIVHVSSSLWVQRRRLSARGMSDRNISVLLSRQVSIEKRRNWADFCVNTSGCLRETSLSVLRIIKQTCVDYGMGSHHVRYSSFTPSFGSRSISQTLVYAAMQ
ncbi:dephospho-CoA kinase [Candidatus Anaplasma sp. TIGMIC]|uniref:dephospho-CoA kinase n=1 Tax=Candidatus Anaplasma sp. TIGMIC TaxID=3020713 RepID=UPI00232C3A0E|nr:dephospho-CoA kinase [Candidatus Anaplasma sp. TIGMIC]MDB1135078.1 dephospho-CoA kinase [Candidatus Anaplasma sp. TIGMIC]